MINKTPTYYAMSVLLGIAVVAMPAGLVAWLLAAIWKQVSIAPWDLIERLGQSGLAIGAVLFGVCTIYAVSVTNETKTTD